MRQIFEALDRFRHRFDPDRFIDPVNRDRIFAGSIFLLIFGLLVTLVVLHVWDRQDKALAYDAKMGQLKELAERRESRQQTDLGLDGGATALSVSLSVDSEPAGAEVILNAEPAGTTPLYLYPLKPGTLTLSIRKPDYRQVDTVIVLGQARTSTFAFALERDFAADLDFLTTDVPAAGDLPRPWGDLLASTDQESRALQEETPRREAERREAERREAERRETERREAERREAERQEAARRAAANPPPSVEPAPVKAPEPEVGEVQVISDPPGATVFLAGRSRGRTPLILQDLRPGRYAVSLQMDGYETASTTVTVRPRGVHAVNEQLTRLVGSVSVLIRPWGTIYIDGALQKRDTDLRFTATLPAGTHRIAAVHPTLGRWEKTVSIEPDRDLRLVVDFNRTLPVMVTADPVPGTIYVDGKSTGLDTPNQVNLPTGLHVIEVRREGYTTEGGSRTVLLEGGAEAVRFTLKQQARTATGAL